MSGDLGCGKVSGELTECARRGEALRPALSEHVASCQPCRERFEAERELTQHLRAMRIASVPPNFEWSKAVLMREFDAGRKREQQIRWTWAMSTAAVLALSVVGVSEVWRRPFQELPPAVNAQSYAPREYPQESFAPAEEAGEKGFIKLPFAMPPAPGETFGIVRTQLDPVQLVRMGVRVDPGWTGSLQADVLVGQDGLAQAVRLSNDTTVEN